MLSKYFSTQIIDLTASTPPYSCAHNDKIKLNETSLIKNEHLQAKIDCIRTEHSNITSIPKYIGQLRIYLVNKPYITYSYNR